MKIRQGTASDHQLLTELWEASVRATHHFLDEEHIGELKPLVLNEALPSLELWVLCTDTGEPMGFMGLADDSLEALFLHPDHFRKGGGRLLLERARELKGRLRVEVNEQNPEALAFYLANGFEVVGRSDVDSAGRPFPLVFLREKEEGEG